jgi:dihydroflavonol-4-reductase
VILVTGGTGLVGAHLLHDLAKAGKKIRALKRAGKGLSVVEKIFSYYSADPASLMTNIEWVEGDVTDIFSVMDAMEGIEQVYHCAALISFRPEEHVLMEKANIEGTENVVNASLEKGIRKLCHVSSIAAIGQPEHSAEITESTSWKSSPGNSRYSISKYGAEREVWRASEEGLNVVIVNPGIIIGPGNWGTGSTAIFPAAYKGIKFYTEGVCGFVDVRDVSKAMIRLMESDISNERFILVSENLDYKQFFTLVHSSLGTKPPAIKASRLFTGIGWRAEKLRSAFTGSIPLLTKETAQAAHQYNSYSNKKIKERLGFEFIPVDRSIKETAELFLRDLTKEMA